jgi:DNA-binding Lrp family transcriptional regulator
MSFTATNTAWKQIRAGAAKEVSATAKLVLLTLANCQNPETFECYPSNAYIAEVTGMDIKTVIKGIKALESAGVITIFKTAGRPNHYGISETGTKSGTTKNGTTKNGGGPIPKLVPETVYKTVKKSTAPKRKVKCALPDDFEISESVRKWAVEKGFDRLDQHYEYFVDLAAAKGYKYLDWDRAFQNAIRQNWARLSEQKSNNEEYL